MNVFAAAEDDHESEDGENVPLAPSLRLIVSVVVVAGVSVNAIDATVSAPDVGPVSV